MPAGHGGADDAPPKGAQRGVVWRKFQGARDEAQRLRPVHVLGQRHHGVRAPGDLFHKRVQAGMVVRHVAQGRKTRRSPEAGSAGILPRVAFIQKSPQGR